MTVEKKSRPGSTSGAAGSVNSCCRLRLLPEIHGSCVRPHDVAALTRPSVTIADCVTPSSTSSLADVTGTLNSARDLPIGIVTVPVVVVRYCRDKEGTVWTRHSGYYPGDQTSA